MLEQVKSERIGFGTVFRILLIGNAIFPLILLLFSMALSASGVPLFKSGDEYVTGSQALFFGAIAMLLWVPWAVLWSALFWLGLVPSLWLYSKFKSFTITYKQI